jgi:HEAT repeats
MKLRWPYVALSMIGVTVLVGIIAWGVRPQEPVYQGKPLSYWVDQLGAPRFTHQANARSALREIGPQAIPFLLARIRQEHSVFRRFYRGGYSRLPARLQRGLPTPRPETLGLHARTFDAIWTIGPSSVALLLPGLRDWDSQVRCTAAAGIAMVGHGLDGPVPALIPLADDPDQLVRVVAIQALGRMGSARRQAIPTVVRALQHDPDGQVRGAAAWTLLGIGPDANGLVLEALRKALIDPDPSTRQWAAIGLWRFTGDSKMISFLMTELGSIWEEMAWRRILPVLGRAGDLAKPAVPVIQMRLAQLEDDRLTVTEQDTAKLTRDVLCQIDPEAAEQVTAPLP